MSSNDDQPVTDGKMPPAPKHFEVHITTGPGKFHVYPVDCHDFREVGRYLQFDDEHGIPVAVFPADGLLAAVRVKTEAMVAQ